MRGIGRLCARLVAFGLFVALLAVPVRAPAEGRDRPPDVVVILTDDQRWDTLWAMPALQRLLVDQGVTYTTAFVPTAVCCPSRASLLTGRYAHAHGVWRNAPPLGGAATFDDGETLATWLDGLGYRTGLVGKYLNGHDGSSIPPGWDRWFVRFGPSAYYDYTVNDDGEIRSFGSETTDYLTDVLATEAVRFVEATPVDEPLFLLLAPPVPHEPAIPAERHEGAFAGIAPWRPPSFDERDVSDKPGYVRRQDRLGSEERRAIDLFRQRQLESLLAVDEMVAAVMEAIARTGRLGSTLIAYTSDNGMLWGEHRLRRKNMPYEAASHVPLVVRWDGVVPAGTVDGRLVAANVDLAATVLEAAGASAEGLDGRSLLSQDRRAMPVEALETRVGGAVRPAYCGARTRGRLYVRYASGFEELYLYGKDAWELENAAAEAPQRVLRRMRDLANRLCGGRVPGM